MPADVCLTMPEWLTLQALSRDLQHDYRLRIEPAHQRITTYYDTFDWRLYNASAVLLHTAGTLVLQSLHTPAVLARTDCESPPVFGSELPCGKLRSLLLPLIDVRALLALFTLQARYTRIRMLNKKAKTVAVLLLEQNPVIDPNGSRLPLASWLWLKPVRGHDKYAKRLSSWLLTRGFRVVHDTRYHQGLAARQLQPGAYSSKMRVSLRPTMRADEATKIILRTLVRVMRQNEAGIAQDIDTEYLHDFRVAMRRTRAALGQLKDVFPPRVTARFKREFASLANLTNPLRDLDVYLLHKAAYTALLPASLQPGIEPLFMQLQRERAKAFRSVVRRLQSKTYANMMQRWETFLDEARTETAEAEHASRSIGAFARQRIEKTCRRVLQSGQRLLQDGDDHMLHQLRIACKKLRYLLEFFVSLFPDKATSRLIKRLKVLQDCLGRYQDICVQVETLQHWAAHLTTGTDKSGQQTCCAIAHLIGVLETEKQTVHQSLPKAFSRFAACTGKAKTAWRASNTSTGTQN